VVCSGRGRSARLTGPLPHWRFHDAATR
jgi:hypothetical protein